MTQLSSGGTQRCLLFPIVHGHGWKSLGLKQHSLLFRSHLYLVKWAKTYRASTFADDMGLELTEPVHLIEGKGVTETQKKKKMHISFLLSIFQFKKMYPGPAM